MVRRMLLAAVVLLAGCSNELASTRHCRAYTDQVATERCLEYAQDRQRAAWSSVAASADSFQWRQLGTVIDPLRVTIQPQ